MTHTTTKHSLPSLTLIRIQQYYKHSFTQLCNHQNKRCGYGSTVAPGENPISDAALVGLLRLTGHHFWAAWLLDLLGCLTHSPQPYGYQLIFMTAKNLIIGDIIDIMFINFLFCLIWNYCNYPELAWACFISSMLDMKLLNLSLSCLTSLSWGSTMTRGSVSRYLYSYNEINYSDQQLCLSMFIYMFVYTG